MTTRLGVRCAARQERQRNNPWMALAFSGSVSAVWYSTPSKAYRPSARRLGQGTSTEPCAPSHMSSTG